MYTEIVDLKAEYSRSWCELGFCGTPLHVRREAQPRGNAIERW
jgi:hypothetical protein